MSQTARFRFGPWTISPALNLLERGTRSIRIEPRAMDVLVLLARRDGAVVSVDELIASVWKGVIVTDGSVYLAISQLRQALDDPADGMQYIETIPKRGYRLTVPVERIEEKSMPAAAATQASSLRQDASSFRWWWLAAGFAGVAIVAVFAITFRGDAPPVPTNSVAIMPFNNLSSDPSRSISLMGSPRNF